MNPYRKTYEGGNKPLTGNDFKLLYGNLDKADDVICRAQTDYKDGLCAPVCTPVEGCNFTYNITVGTAPSNAEGGGDYYGYSDGSETDGITFGSIEMIEGADDLDVLCHYTEEYLAGGEYSVFFASYSYNGLWGAYQNGVDVGYEIVYTAEDVNKKICTSVKANSPA